jgi:hypothetical protein
MSRMSEAQARRDAAMAAIPPEQRPHARRLFAAEDRIEKGIAVRRFYVGYKDKGIIIDLSDELAMLAPKSLDLSAQFIQKDRRWHCGMGMALLREIIAAGETPISNRNEWGAARLALCYLYYDLVLRHYGDGAAEEQVFYLEGFVPPSEPADAYWLLLGDDDRFTLAFVEPDDFPPIMDEAHYARRH